MKLFDYFLIGHILGKNTRRAAREQERREEAKEEMEKTFDETEKRFHLSPVATLILFASPLSIIYTFFKGFTAACWISLFVFICSLYIASHNYFSLGRKMKYYIQQAVCALISFSGFYVFIALKHDKIGIALAVAGGIASVIFSVRSSSVYGSPNP